MTKDELRKMRNQTIKSLNDITGILGLDEMYIDELEKELEDAKKVQVVEHFEAYGQCRDSRRITELEQENAELKEKLKPENCLKLLAKEGYIKFTSNQLIKAKKLLTKFVIASVYFNGKEANLVEEAEQFLKENE